MIRKTVPRARQLSKALRKKKPDAKRDIRTLLGAIYDLKLFGGSGGWEPEYRALRAFNRLYPRYME